MILPLTGAEVRHGPVEPAGTCAVRMLASLGAEVVAAPSIEGIELALPGAPSVGAVGPAGAAGEVEDWAESGAMWLTGRPEGPPLVAPGSPATAARGATAAIRLLTAALAAEASGGAEVAVDGACLLGERAAIAGLTRSGDVSPGGSCRLVPAADGLLAVNLARPEDVELLPAWLEVGAVGGELWDAVLYEVRRRPAEALAARAALVGIPVAVVASEIDASAEPWRLGALAPRPRTGRPGRVVDLSSMWAGPLCANLLGLAGFEVVKVESTARPDGARKGPAAFYDLMHGGHRSVALDFRDAAGRGALARLLDTADVVIESSRPRALEQLGIDPARVLASSPAPIWVSITGYGRSGPGGDRVAFGDDAAAAAGLVARCDGGSAVFCGDAIADPLAGVHAALIALAMWAGGCGGLADVSMRDVVASTIRYHRSGGPVPVVVAEPAARPATVKAASSGADNYLVM